MKTKIEVIEEHKEAKVILKLAIDNYYNCPNSKNAQIVIDNKKIVNQLGIKLWEFAL
jgi:hypothetical protein